MQWQTIPGFAFGLAGVILGLVFIVLGLRASFVQDSTMSVRAWRIYWLFGLGSIGLGFALLGFGLIFQLRPPLFGMSVATASGISSNTNFVGGLFCIAGALVWWLTGNPSMVARNGVLRRVRAWIQGNSSLPEPPNQQLTHD